MTFRITGTGRESHQEKAGVGLIGSIRSLLKPRTGDEWTKFISTLIAVTGLMWGAWEFSFKEILRPASAPVNITLDLKITKPPLAENSMPNCNNVCPPLPITLLAVAKNASNRILIMRKSYWVAHVTEIPTEKANNEEEARVRMISDINSQMTPNAGSLSLEGEASNYYYTGSQEYASNSTRLVGFGPLFKQNEIKPGETISVQRVILIPPSPKVKYKLARVLVLIPTYNQQADFASEDLIRIIGGIDEDENIVQMKFCEVERNPQRQGLVRWTLDKFMLPADKTADRTPKFSETASKYCPLAMSRERSKSIGAQVFTAEHEIPLYDLSKQSMSALPAKGK